MSAVNPDQIEQILRECAEKYILPRYQALRDDEISTKTGPSDLVTQADIEAEAHLECVLPDVLPGSVVIGEEGISRGSSSLAALKDTSRPVWMVDPIDGTYNFVNGRSGFGIMLSCVIDGSIRHGWIYEIVGNNMLTAEKGAGAFLNGQGVRVDNSVDIQDMTGHMSLKFFPSHFRDHLKEQAPMVRSTSPICCASEYLRIATGQSHFSLYCRLKPWDHFAGILIAEEAGAYIAKWDGKPFELGDCDVGLLVAPDQEKWQALHDIFVKELL